MRTVLPVGEPKRPLRGGARRALAVAMMAAGPTTALAGDSCRWLHVADAERAVAVARTADAWMSFARARPRPLASVAVRDHGGGTAELLFDGEGVDLRDTLIRTPGAGWLSLGHRVAGCASNLVPPRLSAAPFVPLGREERSRLVPPRPARWTALAEIPTVLEQWEARPAMPVEVFAEPEEEAAVIATLRRGARSLPSAEWGYERPGAFVVEERSDWVRIRLADGSGWIRRAEAEPIHPLAELVIDGLAYLTASWDGLLYAEPGESDGVARIDPSWREGIFEPDRVPIEALESRSNEGSLWLRVRVTSRPCADGEPGHAWAEGWVPLAGEAGEPAVGFHSRGC